MILLFLVVAVAAPWIGLGLLIKMVWKDCARDGEGMFFKNHLTLESYLIGLLWPFMIPFFVTMVVLYGIITLVHWALNREIPTNH